jgi:TonB family protein
MAPGLKRWLLANAILVSTLIHGALFGGALGYIHWKETRGDSYMNIDLSQQSLLARVASQGGAHAAAPPQPWLMSTGNRMAAPPKQALTQTAQVQEEAGPACPPPCPDNAGDWAPASALSRKPNWTSGLITEDDYPRELRRQNKQGKVVVDVLIDATGAVRGVNLVSGSEAAFNDLVLERLKTSRFRPAYDGNGEAVACRLRLPIVFEIH